MFQVDRSANRVIVVTNKWWECDPILGALLHSQVQPPGANIWPTSLRYPRKRPDQQRLPPEDTIPEPRAVFPLAHATIEIWCISDLLEHYPGDPQYQSSSERKAEQIGKIFRGPKPILVVAVGTTAFPADQSENGNVVIGTKIFMHNAHPDGENLNSNWNAGPFGTIIESPLTRDTFDTITAGITLEVESRYIAPPLNPAPARALLSGYSYVSLATINVTDSEEFERTDRMTLAAYTATNSADSAKSIETTFGLIRVQMELPFLFAGGVLNRMGHFGDEVGPRRYAQTMVAAHNLGVTLAWMMNTLDQAVGSGFP